MSNQFDLFDQAATPGTVKSSAVQSIKVKPSAAQLTPAQHRFNKLISRLDKLNRQMADFDQVIQRHRMPYLQSMEGLEARIVQCRREILLFLHERRQAKGLTASEKKFSFRLIKELLEDMNVPGDAELEALFDLYHSPQEQAQLAEEEALAQESFRDLIQTLMGQPIPDLDSATSPEEMMAAARAHMASQNEQFEAQRESRRSRRAPTARQKKAQQTQQDADSVIRSIFRQLASALHPDRESDPAERERKTELMMQVNTAYESRDLNTLLRLQMRVAQIDEQSIAKLTDEKLAAMSTLLKEQVDALERALAEAEMRSSHEFRFMVSARQSEAYILKRINYQRRSLEELLDAAQADLLRVRSDAGLKQWLKEQKMYSKRMAHQGMSVGDLMGSFF